MKLMLRVSSESKYSFFNRMVIEHIVENGCSRDQRGLNFFCPEVVKSEFDLQNLGCKLCLRCESSSSKAGLYFVKSRLLGGRLYKQGNFLKVDERESGELFEELFWSDVAYFFPMNINFCNLIFERRRNGNDIFLSSNLFAEVKFSFILNVAFPGWRKHCWSFFFLEFSFSQLKPCQLNRSQS